jgi:hypothetical protein
MGLKRPYGVPTASERINSKASGHEPSRKTEQTGHVGHGVPRLFLASVCEVGQRTNLRASAGFVLAARPPP